jgi:hypothetical protein
MSIMGQEQDLVVVSALLEQRREMEEKDVGRRRKLQASMKKYTSRK